LRGKYGASGAPFRRETDNRFGDCNERQVLPPSRRILSARRFGLLATTIAGLGAAFLSRRSLRRTPFSSQARRKRRICRRRSQKLPQHPVGFADIVAKVKPAVISVRVKIDRPADSSLSATRISVPAGLAVRTLLPPLRRAQQR
jgi:hypothetical protein